MKTNEQRLRKLIKENNSIQNALLIERILTITELTKKEIEKNPEAFRTFTTTPEMYSALIKNIENNFTKTIFTDGNPKND